MTAEQVRSIPRREKKRNLNWETEIILNNIVRTATTSDLKQIAYIEPMTNVVKEELCSLGYTLKRATDHKNLIFISWENAES